jgi:hypothetical protein
MLCYAKTKSYAEQRTRQSAAAAASKYNASLARRLLLRCKLGRAVRATTPNQKTRVATFCWFNFCETFPSNAHYSHATRKACAKQLLISV